MFTLSLKGVVLINNDFALSVIDLQKRQTMAELRESNEFTIHYGLSLSEQQIAGVAEQRFSALSNTGRIEFGQGIIKKLLRVFCTSPYIIQENYEDTVLELLDLFYYFKNESMDRISDNELIEFMKNRFDGICQGSLEYLGGTSLEELCRNTRYDRECDDRYGRLF